MSNIEQIETGLTTRKVENVERHPYMLELYEQYVEWYALPLDEREATGYRTTSEWAKAHGVNKNQPSRWQKRPDFIKRVDEKLHAWGNEMTPHAMAGLKLSLMRGKVDAIELWLSYFKGWDKKHIIEQHTQHSYTLDDFRSIIADLSEQGKQKFYGAISDAIAEAADNRRHREVETVTEPGRVAAVVPAEANNLS